MSLKITSDSLYKDMKQSDKRVPTINITELLPQDKANEKDEGMVLPNKQFDNTDESGKKALLNPQKQLVSEMSKANSHLRFRGTKCEFKYYEDVNRVAIKVLDQETNEVIREIPPEETIKLIQKLWEYAGLLYDEKG